MNSRSPLLPLISFVLSSAILFPIEIYAFSGSPSSPYSNGSYFPNTGTFSAVVRGKNLIGTLQFSTTNNAGDSVVTDQNDYYHSVSELSGQYISITGGLGSTGVCVIYNEGETYRGNSNGIYNPASEEMAVMFQGSFPGQGEEKYKTAIVDDLTNEIVSRRGI